MTISRRKKNIFKDFFEKLDYSWFEQKGRPKVTEVCPCTATDCTKIPWKYSFFASKSSSLLFCTCEWLFYQWRQIKNLYFKLTSTWLNRVEGHFFRGITWQFLTLLSASLAKTLQKLIFGLVFNQGKLSLPESRNLWVFYFEIYSMYSELESLFDLENYSFLQTK